MTRRARIHENDLARIVRAIRGTGLEIHSLTIDTEGGVTVAVHPQNVEAKRDEASQALVDLRRPNAECRAERLARVGQAGEKLDVCMLKTGHKDDG